MTFVAWAQCSEGLCRASAQQATPCMVEADHILAPQHVADDACQGVLNLL